MTILTLLGGAGGGEHTLGDNVSGYLKWTKEMCVIQDERGHNNNRKREIPPTHVSGHWRAVNVGGQ